MARMVVGVFSHRSKMRLGSAAPSMRVVTVNPEAHDF